jgi:1,4-dihydroxy-2-naphthoate octaprenyltransferase
MMDGEGKLKNWVLVAHPWALPASVSPALVGLSYVFYLYKTGIISEVNWGYGIVAFFGVILFHLAGNLISEYHDFVSGVDVKEKIGARRLIVEGLFKPKTVLYYGYTMLILGILAGTWLFLHTGWPVLIIGGIGIISVTLYYKFKYVALGDILIFICFGLSIALGMVYVMSGMVIWQTLPVVAPTGLLVVAILHANNTRDMVQDKAAGIRTQAMKLGIEGSQIAYQTQLIVSYVVIAIAVLAEVLTPIAFLVLLSIPLAMKNIKLMRTATIDHLEVIQFLDGMTAQLTLIFSLLLVAANFIAPFI